MLAFNIPGYTGHQATSDGQIIKALKPDKPKSQRRAGNGAMQVDIGKSTCMVHDLVARAFYGCPLTRGYRVRHRNGDRSDNRPENLIWAGMIVLDEDFVEVDQPPTLSLEVEKIYNRAHFERMALIELMQA